jgi:hypothetical protein
VEARFEGGQGLEGAVALYMDGLFCEDFLFGLMLFRVQWMAHYFADLPTSHFYLSHN